MGRKNKKKVKKQKQRAYKYDTLIQRMLIPPVFNPYLSTHRLDKLNKNRKKRGLKPIRKINKYRQRRKKRWIESLKRFEPMQPIEVATYPIRKVRAKITGPIKNIDPRNISVCHRRKIRREELFKRGLVGKGIAVSKIRITTPLSKIWCRRR